MNIVLFLLDIHYILRFTRFIALRDKSFLVNKLEIFGPISNHVVRTLSFDHIYNILRLCIILTTLENYKSPPNA